MDLIPKPAKMKMGEGEFLLRQGTAVCLSPDDSERCVRQAALFVKEAEARLGFALMLVRGQGRPGDVIFRKQDENFEGCGEGRSLEDRESVSLEETGIEGDADIGRECFGQGSPAVSDRELREQSYRLRISPEGVELSGPERGLWYGMQTLLQIIDQVGGLLPALEIRDEPALPNRGYYFDCTRGRVPKLEWLKKLADRMAYYKLNQLQLYIEHTYLFRDIPELWRDDTPLTAAEILELDDYCADRGVELVPSLSSFGHLYKLLSTRSYAHLCELEGALGQPFSVLGRMAHHTIDPTNPESLALIQSMIGEYMALFRSRKFNFCGDETFDLGTGRSRAAAEKLGKDRLYIDYVKALAEFLVKEGRQPMFWGDVILNFPELIRELPEGIVCLNWGYSPDVEETPIRKLWETGAVQYCCPGCGGWNRFAPSQRDSYLNISRQCGYAVKYGARGLLNTDWGDYYHINHPDLSRAGMIYGAAFSWNPEIPPYEEINRQISRLEYGDRTGRLLEIADGIGDNEAFGWGLVCHFQERRRGILTEKEFGEKELRSPALLEKLRRSEENNRALEEISRALYGHLQELSPEKRTAAAPYLTAAEGIRLWNRVGRVVTARECGVEFDTETEEIRQQEPENRPEAENQPEPGKSSEEVERRTLGNRPEAENQREIRQSSEEVERRTLGDRSEVENQREPRQQSAVWELAADLENWLYRYKQQYRMVSKESELRRLEALVCWYGDYLRDGEDRFVNA